MSRPGSEQRVRFLWLCASLCALAVLATTAAASGLNLELHPTP